MAAPRNFKLQNFGIRFTYNRAHGELGNTGRGNAIDVKFDLISNCSINTFHSTYVFALELGTKVKALSLFKPYVRNK